VTGRRVRSLVLERPDAGEIVWDGRDADGRVASAGVYWLRLSGAERASTIRVVKMR
jgi:hypothetical protein